MIRLVHLLRRQSHLSQSEFSKYLRNEHGPLVAARQSRLGILRHTQSCRLDEPRDTGTSGLRGQLEAPYDGVLETWWDSEESAGEALRSEPGQALLADEARFVDLPRSPVWLAHEYPQFSVSLTPVVARPSGSIVKAHFVLRHWTDMSSTEAQRYWLTVHGPLIRSMAPVLGLLSYQQVHRFESPLERELRDARGTTVEPYMGHAEMWFDRAVRRRGPEMAAADVRAAEDEAKFIDFERSATWLSREDVLVDRW